MWSRSRSSSTRWGSAIDELVVSLPDDVSRELLLSEIGQVDGVAIEDLRLIEAGRPDAGMLALEMAAALVETAPEDRLSALCTQLQRLVDGSWSLAMRSEDGTSLVERGVSPDHAWLAAFFAGSRHIASAITGNRRPAMSCGFISHGPVCPLPRDAAIVPSTPVSGPRCGYSAGSSTACYAAALDGA